MTRTHFIRSRRLLTTALFVLAIAPYTKPALGQSVPQTINFQGRLAKPDGTPVADTASQSLTFRLYSAQTGGTLLWSQTGSIPVRNGVFAARLNFTSGYTTGNTLATIFGSSTFTPYLEIQVGADAPLAPRQPFSSQAYALYANTASMALAVPNGSITSANIADNSITSAKLASDIASLNKVSGGVLTSNGSNIGIGLNSFLTAGLTDRFTVDGKSIGATSLGWYNDSWNTFGATAWFAGYSGIKLFTDVSATPRLVITESGNVGIGTTTPTTSLHVNGNFRTSGKALIGPSTSLDDPAAYGERLVVDGAVRLFSDLRVDGKDGLTLDGSGAGLRFPDGSRQTTAAVVSGTNAGGDLTGSYPNPTIAAGAVTNAKLANDAASLSKVSGGAMTSSGGFIGIGTTSPTVALHVSTAGDYVGFFENASNTFTRLRLQNNNTAHAYDMVITGNNSGLGGGKLMFVDGTASVVRMTVDTSGNVGISTATPAYKLDVNGNARVTSLTQSSDARYKTNVATFPNALDTILGLRGVTFDWNRDRWQEKAFPAGRQVGFLAQEVETVLPELVATDRDGYKSVAYQNVVPVLVEAMKQQQTQINALQSDNAELKRQNTRIAELETKLNALLAAGQGKSPR